MIPPGYQVKLYDRIFAGDSVTVWGQPWENTYTEEMKCINLDEEYDYGRITSSLSVMQNKYGAMLESGWKQVNGASENIELKYTVGGTTEAGSSERRLTEKEIDVSMTAGYSYSSGVHSANASLTVSSRFRNELERTTTSALRESR